MTKARRNVEEKPADENVNLAEGGRRSRTGDSPVGSGSEVVRVENGSGCRRIGTHPVHRRVGTSHLVWNTDALAAGLHFWCTSAKRCPGPTGASGVHGVHGVSPVDGRDLLL